MRKLLSSTLTLLLLAAAAYADAAQNAAKVGDDEIKSAFSKLDVETRIRLMKKFDKDGDGRLSPEERKEAMEAMKGKAADLESLRQKHVEDVMNRFDKDGDGKLDKSELAGFLEEQRKMFDEQRRRMGPPRKFQPPKEILAKYDKNGDGKIDAEERRAIFKDARERREKLVKKYDKNGDGILDDSERETLIKDPEVQNMMKRMLSRPLPPPPRD